MSRSQLDRPGRPAGLGDDDSGCPILHVDMDAFYASCELRTRPELRGRPMVVGVDGGRSVVLAATYEARRFGIHSAMPMSQARRLCPGLVAVAPTFGLYTEVSHGVMSVFAEVTDLIEPLSLDEAFLDVGAASRRMGRPRQIGEHIRRRVRREQGITCSVGVASTKHVAKLASTRCKPDGLLVVPVAEVLTFLHPLPVRALWGVGDKTALVLERLGLRTVGDLAQAPVGTLHRSLGRAAGHHLHDLAWGRDPRPVVPHEPERSIGAEETFGTDVADPVVIKAELLRLAERVGARLRGQQLVARTVALKVRFADFTTITRSRTLGSVTDVGREVYSTAAALFDALDLTQSRLRLVGIRAEGLLDARSQPRQLALDEPEQGWREAEQAVDRAIARYGHGVLVPARLLDRTADPRATRQSLAVPREDLPAPP